MFIVSKNSINALAPELLTTKLSKKVPVALKVIEAKKEGDKPSFANALSSKEQDAIYDSMKLNNVHIKAKELFAMQTSFDYKGKEYHGVLQKKGKSLIPVKLYEKAGEKLVEVEPFDFVKGKNGEYYSIDELNKFISSIVLQTQGEVEKAPMKYTKSIVEFIEKNVSIENNKAQIKLNYDNVEEWTKIIQSANTVKDFEVFKARTRTKLRMLFPYISEDKIVSISDTFVDKLKEGKLGEIGKEHITKISLSDIPTLQRLWSTQLTIEGNPEYASRNKMLVNFLSNSDFNIKSCLATNYLLAGVSNSNVPVFYLSATINDNTFTNTFNKDLDKAKKTLAEKIEGKTNIKDILDAVNEDKDNLVINRYAFLLSLRDSLFQLKDDNKVKELFKNIDEALKDLNADSKLTKNIFSTFIKNETIGRQKNIYKNTLDGALMLLRAEVSNELEVKLTKAEDRIYNSQHGQNIPIEFLYSTNELVGNFTKNVGLKKENGSVEASYGASLVGVTEVENQNGKLIPIKTHRLTYNETGYEQISELVSKLALVNENGKLVYTNIDKDFKEKVTEYDFNIDNGIDNLRKVFDIKFKNKSTGTLKVTDSIITEPLDLSIKKIEALKSVKLTLAEKVKEIHKIIKEDNLLNKLLEIGASKKPDFEKNRTITLANQNQNQINKFIENHKDNLLGDTVYIKRPKYPAYIKDKDEGFTLANRAARATILELAKNIYSFQYIEKAHNNNVKATIDAIKKVTNGTSKKYDGFLNNEKLKEMKASKELAVDTFIKKVASLIAAKHTVEVPPYIDNMYAKMILEKYYPNVEDDIYKTRIVDTNHLLDVVKNETSKTQEALYDIDKQVSNAFGELMEGKIASRKTPKISFNYTLEEDEEILEELATDEPNETLVASVNSENEVVSTINEEEIITEDVMVEEEIITEEVEELEVENEEKLENSFNEPNPFDEIDIDMTALNTEDIIEDVIEEEMDFEQERLSIIDNTPDIKDELSIPDFDDDMSFDDLGDIHIPTLEEKSADEEIELNQYTTLAL